MSFGKIHYLNAYISVKKCIILNKNVFSLIKWITTFKFFENIKINSVNMYQNKLFVLTIYLYSKNIFKNRDINWRFKKMIIDNNYLKSSNKKII